MTFAQHVLYFLFHLQLPFKLPKGIHVMDVHKDDAVKQSCELFYTKFYNDNNRRHLILGINPGRFGGGVTGIPFTDPIRLEKDCGIKNDFVKKQELSSLFIYEMMNSYGSAEKFYQEFYISAISPLGFVKNGKNLNYYDDEILLKKIDSFVMNCITKQITFGLYSDICFCIGEGENFKYLFSLNQKYKWFAEIKALPHPRFIMQYRLKQKKDYIQKYLDSLFDR